MKKSTFVTISLLSTLSLLSACSGPKNNAADAANPKVKPERIVLKPGLAAACSDELAAALTTANSALTKLKSATDDKVSIEAAQKACTELKKNLPAQACELADNENEQMIQVTKDTLKEECAFAETPAAPVEQSSTKPTQPAPAEATTAAQPSASATQPSSPASPTSKTGESSAATDTQQQQQQSGATNKAFDSKSVTSFKKGLTFTIKSPDILKQSVLRIGYIQGGFLVEATTDLDSTLSNCVLKDVSSSFEVKADQAFTMTKISVEGNILTAISSDGALNLEFTRGAKANLPPEWTIKELKEALGSAVEISAIE